MQAAPALNWHTALAQAAERHSLDMAANNHFSHTGTDGSSMNSRVTQAGYAWSGLAENIAAGNSTAEATVRQWLGSPQHCQSLMNPSYVHLGGACGYSAQAQYRYYWTINLGRPR